MKHRNFRHDAGSLFFALLLIGTALLIALSLLKPSSDYDSRVGWPEITR